MVDVIQSSTFSTWLAELNDANAKVRILTRIQRLALGNPGDVKPVGEGVSELRIDYGPGYRVYFWQRGLTTILLLCAGDKRTQSRDIETAKSIVKLYKQEADTHGNQPRKKK